MIAGTYTYSSAAPLLCHAFLGPPLTHYGGAGWGLVTGWWNTADKVLPPAQAAHTTSHPRQISELDEGLNCVWLGHKQTERERERVAYGSYMAVAYGSYMAVTHGSYMAVTWQLHTCLL